MTRSRRPTTRAAVAAAVGAACSHPAKPTKPAKPPMLALPAAYEARALSYPTSGTPAREFAVCPPGIVVVPTQGGLWLAGWNDWLRKPGKHLISSVDCDASARVFYIRDGALTTLGPDDRIVELGALPAGDFHVIATVDGAAWVWGTTDRKVSVIYRYERKAGLRQIASVSAPIGAAATAGTTALVTAMGPRLVLWQRDAKPQVMATLEVAPDGIAVQPSGDLWVSVPKGILTMKANGAVEVFAVGLHGPMRARGHSLYVLEAEESQVVRLRPAGEKDEDGELPPTPAPSSKR